MLFLLVSHPHTPTQGSCYSFHTLAYSWSWARRPQEQPRFTLSQASQANFRRVFSYHAIPFLPAVWPKKVFLVMFWQYSLQLQIIFSVISANNPSTIPKAHFHSTIPVSLQSPPVQSITSSAFVSHSRNALVSPFCPANVYQSFSLQLVSQLKSSHPCVCYGLKVPSKTRAEM